MQRGGALPGRQSVVGPERSPAEVLAEALADPDRLVIVGTLDGVEVGFALARCELAGLTPVGRH